LTGEVSPTGVTKGICGADSAVDEMGNMPLS
jgi:hypothetical protein